MADTNKPKRPHSKSARARSRPPLRDPRAEEVEVPRDVVARDIVQPLRSTRPKVEALPARIAILETELAGLKEERGADADELARMLVRIAAAERAKAAAEEHAGALTDRARELDAIKEEVRRVAETKDHAVRRAELAERSAADGAAALERTRAELESDRARFTDLEVKVARTRREHGEELAELRAAHAEASLQMAHALEAERAATIRAREQAAAAEASLAAAREILARATGLIEEIERREEMTAAMRARSLEQTRRVLAGEASLAPTGDPSVHPAALPVLKTAKRAVGWPPEASTADSSVEVTAIEEIEGDLGD